VEANKPLNKHRVRPLRASGLLTVFVPKSFEKNSIAVSIQALLTGPAQKSNYITASNQLEQHPINVQVFVGTQWCFSNECKISQATDINQSDLALVHLRSAPARVTLTIELIHVPKTF
jgi:hypothetical protein